MRRAAARACASATPSATTASSGTSEGAALITRLVARQGEQPLHQVDGPFDGRAQIGALHPRGLVALIEQLQVEAHCGQRRARFMGGIGDEWR